METLKFKTNIKCGGCVATITPYLNNFTTIKHWEVDIENPDKVLIVNVEDHVQDREIIETLQKAGYTAEKI